MHRVMCLFLLSWLLLGSLFLVGCGGSSTTRMATVNVSVSDPPTCAAPKGPYAHVYVTITDVLIHQSSGANANDSGWVDLTPNLKNSPAQVDMLGLADSQCFLAMLGSAGIPAGTYQQIRIILAPNNASVSGNKCGPTANCVMLTSSPTTPQPLLLSSEAKTGIKIPSGQIAGGRFTVAAGETKDLNIDFNACASIVVQGNGQYRLKPVLHAGEISTASASVSGTVIDGGTTLPVVSGNTVVALEQKDSFGVDRVIMETVAAANGTFVFCPVPAGTYDLVVTSINGVGTTYAATVITGVQPGAGLGNVTLTPAALPASISGQLTSSTGSAATPVDLSLSALQPITVNSATVLITVPLAQQSSSTLSLATEVDVSCPVNTDCVSYTLAVPAANPSVGAFVAGNQLPAPPAGGAVSYTVDANALVPGSAGVLDCNPSNLQTNNTVGSTPLTVLPGGPVTAATLAFTGCQ